MSAYDFLAVDRDPILAGLWLLLWAGLTLFIAARIQMWRQDRRAARRQRCRDMQEALDAEHSPNFPRLRGL